jgi:hypothetical protein
MLQVQEKKSATKETLSLPFLHSYFPIICAVSLTCYLIFSHGLRYLLTGWNYYTQLFKMVFPKGFIEGLPQLVPLLPNFSSLYNCLLFMGFISVCIASAWLAHSLLDGRRSELGPHLILFSLATAIVPSLLLAIFFWPDGRGKLTLAVTLYASLFVAIVLAGLKLTLFRMKTPSQLEPKFEDLETIGWAWAFLPLTAIIFYLAYIRGTISIVGYDALAYHLPLAASWFHNGSITRGFDIQFFYPGNAELMLRWSFIFRSDCFVFLVPFITTILCIYMIYKLGRVTGQGKEAALIAACCGITIPMIPFLASIANIDTLGVLFLLLSVFFLIRWIQSNLEAHSHLLCTGLAVGLAAGTKMTTLTSVLAISLVAIIGVLRSRRLWRSTGPRLEDVGLNWPWLLTRAGAFIFVALLGGGYWYLRNLMEHGNPFYPVSMLGLPGLKIKTILAINPEFVASLWKRLLYPWTEFTYVVPYEEGTGAIAAEIVIPALLVWPFLRHRISDAKRVGPGIIYSIAAMSLILFAWTGNMMIRYGIFPILISFILVGEFWSSVRSIWLRAVTLAAFLIMTIAIIHSLAGGYLYMYLRNNEMTRNEKLNVPAVVDSLPPTRIINATGAWHTYGLMGRDYRHEVVTLFNETKPGDVLTFDAKYVLITKAQEETFRAKLPLEYIGTETKGADPVSLWKIVKSPHNTP